jgi:outer membrane protein OmpA-like peptidoglycan-associated protein
MNGYQDADGCPDELPDHDKDGIPDNVDKCPDAGGPDVIRDAKSQYYGCPDRDHDGVPDYLDKCPDEPEATDDLWDGSGCPHVHDQDKDGIPDDVDKCPTQPETYNGYQDADGCPDKGPTTVEITATSINIHDRIEFAVGKDTIQGVKSFQVLDAVAGVLNGHKDIRGIEVGGHTDNTGSAELNRALSQKRAEAVVAYFVGKGVEPNRLTAKGYGPDVAIASNKTAAGRQQNRRVEFHIVGTSTTTTTVTAPPAAAPAAPPAAVPPKG